MIHKMVYGHCVLRTRPKEIKEKARALIEGGASKSRVAYELSIPLGTLSHWNIPSPNPPKNYCKEIKDKAAQIFLSGC